MNDKDYKPYYTIEKLLKTYKPNTQDFVFFWGNQKHKSGRVTKSCFSQWWEETFKVGNITYISAEQYMMANKALVFDDMKIHEQILGAKAQWEIKELGRLVKNFDEKTWQDHRYQIVVEGNYHKFTQNPDLKEFLLSTKDKILVEASPMDIIWGVGMSASDEEIKNPANWRGKNLLGFALMEVRDRIRELE